MKRGFLGDSYDAVKRLWRDILEDWATLYADPKFIPVDLREEFTRLTRIPILPDRPTGAFSILNDPDSGIRLPGEENQKESRTHTTITRVVSQLQKGARCVVTYDQSDYRNHPWTREEQRQAKMKYLSGKGGICFYYVSHAPFLFAVQNKFDLTILLEILKNSGIPDWRLESIGNIIRTETRR